jgi:hypothetical protein
MSPPLKVSQTGLREALAADIPTIPTKNCEGIFQCPTLPSAMLIASVEHEEPCQAQIGRPGRSVVGQGTEGYEVETTTKPRTQKELPGSWFEVGKPRIDQFMGSACGRCFLGLCTCRGPSYVQYVTKLSLVCKLNKLGSRYLTRGSLVVHGISGASSLGRACHEDLHYITSSRHVLRSDDCHRPLYSLLNPLTATAE